MYIHKLQRALLVCSLFTLLGACGGTTAPQAMTPVGPPASWSQGSQGPLGEYESTLVSDGVSHRIVVHVPPGYDPARGAPLLIHFHGLASSLPFDVAGKMHKLWAATADAQGFLLAAPEALPCPQSANDPKPPGCWSPNRDVPFVKAFVAHLAGLYNVDRDRVYLSGHSNGSFFVDSAALMDSTQYAAVVEFSGGCSDDTGSYTSCPTLDKLAKAAPRKTPYFTIHFPGDMNVPSSWTDNLVAMLTANGYITKQLDSYDSYDAGGNGHTPDPAVAPSVWAWLSTFSLATAP